jgi:aromatic-L-amino-acid decarboxylase
MPPGQHMTPDEFRRHGREVVDWIADYLEQVEELPVLSRVAPGDVLSALPERAPDEGEPLDAMLADVERVILPGLTHWQSPNFFAYFPANSSGPSVLGELLSAGLGVQGMLWATSPAATELETRVCDWLVHLMGMPERFLSAGRGGGVIQDSASSAMLCALIAARQRAVRDGARLEDLTVYSSEHAHSSVQKAVRIAGLAPDALRLIDADPATHALRPQVLLARLAEDREAGRRPLAAVASVGTTSSLAVDPLREIGEIAREQGLWLHVDAAMAGSAAVAPELRWINDGVELVDSYCFNPHKWLLTNFDCDVFWVADRSALIDALSILPEYLRNEATESGEVIDYRDWEIPLGRRFRALKLWFVLRWYGAEGLREFVRGHVALARDLAERVREHDAYELAAPATLNLVCFRHRGGDEVNQRIMDEINASGRAYLTHTKLEGKLTLRLSIGQTQTERRHVEAVWRQILELGEQLK